MDKKVDHAKKEDKNVRTRKLGKKAVQRIGALICFFFGVTLICAGSVRIYNLNSQVGTESVDELTSKVEKLSEEYDEVERQKAQEVEKNGFSDKYNELAEKSAELNIAITKASNSKYMIETGYNNPRSLGDMLRLAPMLWIGGLLVTASIIALFAFREMNR